MDDMIGIEEELAEDMNSPRFFSNSQYDKGRQQCVNILQLNKTQRKNRVWGHRKDKQKFALKQQSFE
jgi:hypothetical protein